MLLLLPLKLLLVLLLAHQGLLHSRDHPPPLQLFRLSQLLHLQPPLLSPLFEQLLPLLGPVHLHRPTALQLQRPQHAPLLQPSGPLHLRRPLLFPFQPPPRRPPLLQLQGPLPLHRPPPLRLPWFLHQQRSASKCRYPLHWSSP